MKNFIRLAAFLAAFAFVPLADAATCFWVGGAGSWSTANAASWSSSTGGAGSTCAATGGIPKQAADTATFDGASGGGTVTVDTTINGVTLTQITTGAFTGTLDFSVNNPSLTLTNKFDASGSGTHSIKLGSGTFTFTSGAGTVFDFTNTNLTLTAGTSTLLFSATTTNQRTANFGSKTYATITLAGNGGGIGDFRPSGSPTIGTFNVNAPNTVWPQSAFTVSTALNINGTAANNVVNFWLLEGSGTTVTLSGSATISWAVIGGLTFTGSPTANNSFDAGKNVGITINGPSGGGGSTGHIIGG